MRHIPRCQHIKINGTQCGSPAMRGRRLCYFHLNTSNFRTFVMGQHPNESPYTIPLLEDAESIQIALMRIMELIFTQGMDNKRAGLMLYALQTAASNIGRASFQPRSSSVVISKEMTRDTPLNEDPLDELLFGVDDQEEEDEDPIEDREELEIEAEYQPRVAGPHVHKEAPKDKRPRPQEPETVAKWLADISRSALPS